MSRKVTTKDFIDRARAVHSDKYGYAFSVYQSTKTKVSIYCHDHGMFEQSPANHIKGSGCPGCAAESKTHTSSLFIEKAKEFHGDRYNYSKVEYKTTREKVIIVCHEHGDFEQTPHSHLKGRGCPGCANSGFDKTKNGFLYVLRSDCGSYMKIGITNNTERRHTELTRDTPFSFKRIELVEGPGNQIANLEKELLAKYQPAGFDNQFDGYSEWRLWDDSIRGYLV